MNWQRINDWLQVAGIFGVIISLMFVGMQMRQTHRIAEAEIYQARAALKLQNFALEAASPVMQEALRKTWAGEPLTENESRNVGLFWYSWLAYWENNYFQYKAGMMSQEQWRSSTRAIRRFSRVSGFKEWWSLVRDDWPDSFQKVVDDSIAHESGS